jgi:hypothetical protein
VESKTLPAVLQENHMHVVLTHVSLCLCPIPCLFYLCRLLP